jgi:hypothetical protein
VDTETGELQESRLEHSQEAERFYRGLKERRVRARVGMEASGQARFERLLAFQLERNGALESAGMGTFQKLFDAADIVPVNNN